MDHVIQVPYNKPGLAAELAKSGPVDEIGGAAASGNSGGSGGGTGKRKGGASAGAEEWEGPKNKN